MKHIFIGLDGTANAAFYDKFKTNIHRLNLSLDHRDKRRRPQLFIYSAGVGASYNELFASIGKAFGQGIDEIILEAYVNLVSNYESGDRIYIFGFSRGAIAARALSGLISSSGLLKAEYSVMIEEAWKNFVGEKTDFAYGEIKRRMTHRRAKIRFLGVWDTVYGRAEKPPEKDRFTRLRLRSLELDQSVSTGIHVLSLDDQRAYFHPFLWLAKCRRRQKMEQIWLPGVHSDIGGGYKEGFLSSLSLLTMIDKLHQYCRDVKFDAEYIREFVIEPMLEDPTIIVVHDEGLNAALGDRKQARVVDAGAISACQYVHPIVTLLQGVDIEIRGGKTKYDAKGVRRGSELTLPLASFAKTSVYASLHKALKRRLEPKEAKIKRAPKREPVILPINGSILTSKRVSSYAVIIRFIRQRLRPTRTKQAKIP